MNNRLCFFSFYDKDGIVDGYIDYLLNDISNVVDRLIIVVNGKLSQTGNTIFEKYTKEIIIRSNKGFDAGAYKDALKYIGQDQLHDYEELVFCNDTFFGPFISFQKIFDEMQTVECDFWGLNGYFNIVFAHIQSYFLVFRKEIINEEIVWNYFYRYIDENTDKLNDVYCQFETGLFDYLSRVHNKKYSIYAKESNYDVYNCSFKYLSELNLPIVKKKTFSDIHNEKDNTLYTLKYIKENTDYDINLFLTSIRRCYSLKISSDQIDNINYNKEPIITKIPFPISSDEEIEKFCGEGKFYIYGAGMFASKTFWRYAKENENFLGFIVSNGRRDIEDTMFGKTIYELEEIKNVEQQRIVLGIGPEYSEDVYALFLNKENIMRIF